MEDNTLRVVYVLDNNTELRVLADDVEQRNGWILAVWHNKIVGGVKEECLKAFYLKASIQNTSNDEKPEGETVEKFTTENLGDKNSESLAEYLNKEPFFENGN